MIYAGILAGGQGSRLKSSKIPKQYVSIGGTPIIISSIMPFLANKRIDAIYVAVNSQYIGYTEELLKKAFLDEDLKRIFIVKGGNDRMDTFFNIIDAIASKNGINEDDIIIYQEGARPFTDESIINSCINATLEYKIATAVRPSTYTIAISNDGDYLQDSLDRNTLFEIHTPSGFNCSLLYEELKKNDDCMKKSATCVSQLMLMLGYKVKTVVGEDIDFKITTDRDLDLAKYIYENKKMHESV